MQKSIHTNLALTINFINPHMSLPHDRHNMKEGKDYGREKRFGLNNLSICVYPWIYNQRSVKSCHHAGCVEGSKWTPFFRHHVLHPPFEPTQKCKTVSGVSWEWVRAWRLKMHFPVWMWVQILWVWVALVEQSWSPDKKYQSHEECGGCGDGRSDVDRRSENATTFKCMFLIPMTYHNHEDGTTCWAHHEAHHSLRHINMIRHPMKSTWVLPISKKDPLCVKDCNQTAPFDATDEVDAVEAALVPFFKENDWGSTVYSLKKENGDVMVDFNDRSESLNWLCWFDSIGAVSLMGKDWSRRMCNTPRRQWLQGFHYSWQNDAAMQII